MQKHTWWKLCPFKVLFYWVAFQVYCCIYLEIIFWPLIHQYHTQYQLLCQIDPLSCWRLSLVIPKKGHQVRIRRVMFVVQIKILQVFLRYNNCVTQHIPGLQDFTFLWLHCSVERDQKRISRRARICAGLHEETTLKSNLFWAIYRQSHSVRVHLHKKVRSMTVLWQLWFSVSVVTGMAWDKKKREREKKNIFLKEWWADRDLQ